MLTMLFNWNTTHTNFRVVSFNWIVSNSFIIHVLYLTQYFLKPWGMSFNWNMTISMPWGLPVDWNMFCNWNQRVWRFTKIYNYILYGAQFTKEENMRSSFFFLVFELVSLVLNWMPFTTRAFTNDEFTCCLFIFWLPPVVGKSAAADRRAGYNQNLKKACLVLEERRRTRLKMCPVLDA